MNQRQVDRTIAYLAALIPIAGIGMLLFLLWPRTPLAIHQYEVYNDISLAHDRSLKSYEVKAGEEIEFEIVFSKKMDVACEVTLLLKQVDNGYLYPYDDMPKRITRMPIVSNSHYQNAILIPTSTPEGKYVFIRSYSCPINPLNTFEVSKTSNEFMVKGRVKNQVELIKEGNEISRQNQNMMKKALKK
jgi:hypothetical protein